MHLDKSGRSIDVQVAPKAARRLLVPHRRSEPLDIRGVVRALDLRWKSIAHARSGQLPISPELALSPCDLRKLAAPAVTMSYVLDGKSAAQKPVAAKAGGFTPISVHVERNSDASELGELWLSVYIYQPGSAELPQEVLICGSLTQRLAIVPPNRRAEHCLQVCFVAPGTYLLAASVQAAGVLTWSHKPATITVCR